MMTGFVVIYQMAYANRVYPGVRAFGHDLGGYSREEAGAVLQGSLDDLARHQVALVYGDQTWTFTARELGLRPDAGPVLESVFSIGRDGNIFGRFSTQFGLWRQGRSFEQPSSAFDAAIQTTILQQLAGEIDRPASEVKLAIKPDYSVDLQPAQSGRKLDLEASRQRLQEALSVPNVARVELVVQEVPPKSGVNNLALAREQAARILSGPITLKQDEKTWVLDRPQLASVMRFNDQPDATEAAYLDRPPLEAWARTLADAVNQSPQDARFSWAEGKLDVLRPSRNGVELDVDATVDAIVAEARGEHRPIQVPVKTTRPAVPMEDRQNLGIRELIESARTPFAGSVQAKQDNISLASQRLNGVVVPPGGLFSFNQALGPTTLDSGFKTGWGITTAGAGVKTVPSVAGGICQVATTLFQTVFWSGYQIEERNWHLYWIQSYTSKGVVGLDATVDEDANLDFKFINPSKDYILIQSWVDSGLNVNFALYGTRPDWVVKVDPPVKTDIVSADSATTYIEEEATMPLGNRLQVERATDGFTVTNVRHVVRGSDDRTLRLVSRYRPSRNVVLVGTGGKPPGPATVLDNNKPVASEDKPAPAAPTAVPPPTAAATAVPTATAAQSVAPAVATTAPTPAPTAAPAAPATPAPTKSTQPTAVATSNPSAPNPSAPNPSAPTPAPTATAKKR